MERESERMNDRQTIVVPKESMHELLIQLDQFHTLLGVELALAFSDGYFDPDAHYTPLEERIIRITRLCGFDYRDDVHAEANRRISEEEQENDDE